MSNKLSIGLLIGDRAPSWWFTKSIERILSNDDICIGEIVIPSAPDESPTEKNLKYYISYFIENKCWSTIELSKKISDKYIPPIQELRKMPITSINGITKTDIKNCSLIPVSKYRVTLPEETVDRLSETDVVFHSGVGILAGTVLDAPKYGVWGIHHGDFRKYRGGPPGFWEYINGEDVAVSTLQRYGSKLDGGNVILEKEIDITDARTWREVRKIMCRETIPMLETGIKNYIYKGQEAYKIENLGPIHSRSDRDCKTAFKYLSRTISGYTQIMYDDLKLSGPMWGEQ